MIESNDPMGPTMMKLGKGNNPTKRLRTFQTGNPCTLTLLGTIECEDSTQAFELEKELHERFKHLRDRGEWFYARYELYQFIKNATEEYGKRFTKYLYCIPMKPRKDRR